MMHLLAVTSLDAPYQVAKSFLLRVHDWLNAQQYSFGGMVFTLWDVAVASLVLDFIIWAVMYFTRPTELGDDSDG